ncbi:MAG: hypothetical protein PVI91_15555 [Gammaproteobacteria bacterium]|jgi:hypothetical protein
MVHQHHVLEIYEPYEYNGPNPLNVEGIAVLAGPSRDAYYLLQLARPLELEHERTEQMLVVPRYNGDTIDRAVTGACTVNIARIPPGASLEGKARLSFEDFLRWGVGKISPCPVQEH